ncbi:MAG: ribonuclease III [Pseudomonadota bacterium]
MAPVARRKKRTTTLEKALQYTFADRALLDRALTHASVRSDGNRDNNERLEFLGDRVLGLATAEQLWRMHPEAREGELARTYNMLVRREACARVARALDLGAFIRLSQSEADSGGRDKDTILADAMEAVLGAVMIDGGYDKARGIVHRLWEITIEEPVHNVDPKSALQEWAQAQGCPLPSYRRVSRTGPDHAPSFVTEVIVEGYAPAVGDGPSVRQSEQAAAEQLLKREGVREPSDD